MNGLIVLWSLLERTDRRRFLLLLIFTTISGFVEILSVGLVIPFIALASGSLPFGRANSLTHGLIELVGSLGTPPRYTTAALGLVFLLGVCFANLYLCGYQLYAAFVVQGLRRDLGIRIMRNVSTHRLEWLDHENSSDLMKVSIQDVGNTCAYLNAITQVAAILTRCCIVYLFFLYAQFRLALVLAGSLLLLYHSVFRFIQRPIVNAGKSAYESQAQMARATSELIAGAREVRTTSTAHRFFGRFVRAAEASVRPQVIRTMPNYLTRAGLETATVALVIGLLVYFNAKDGNLANGLPLMSSYAVAGIRLLPALQQSLTYVWEIKFLRLSLDEVARLLLREPEQAMDIPVSGPSITLQRSLVLRQIDYSYSPERPVLENISLSIDKNSRVAFVGETGAGKSTLIDIILALRYPQKGSLWADDVEITEQNAHAWRRDLGYVAQSIYLLDATIAENVAFGFSPEEVDPDRLARACETASLTTFIASLPEGYQTFVGERGVRLSGGQCQRIGIARALYHDPDIVIFDEATSSLDSMTENSVLEALDKLKGAKTLIVIAHRLNTVWDFDKIFVLDQGQLVDQGTAQELLKTCPAFQKLAQHQINLGTDSEQHNEQTQSTITGKAPLEPRECGQRGG